MLKSDNSISNISIHCGFTTLPHFSKCFKDQFQMTPKQAQKAFFITDNN
ncbi:helix-turn-helix domain-containing protein [Colwellia maritima]